ncbi:hypothetical protein SDRG_13875 [Saprolegnia diclina VS20]|uniref:Myosin motor domain-containing protein n=1 Tax=Saprolegnia diclina (strain VS20) TaxID=1156394 RepID=T0RF72_SAPDV|nr:hypothetical protein SDRG_13875 [Saprolegnia diclina VS20]EQC28327.1 hypothetical protein SDRG_13875 [Saprolegnia diclina VS20]|eukprot:XP_008618197.1 hypothetical protein SDRG_13875 [Saprolegnia diclina VS20]
MEIGTPVWVLAEDRVWRRAVVHATTPTSLGCRLTDAIDEASRVLAFPATAVGSKVFVCNPIEQREVGVEDLTALVHLHEPAILHTLKVRFMKREIYTSTGSILVAVNPFQALALYDERIKTRYIAHGSRAANGEKLAPLPPHVASS